MSAADPTVWLLISSVDRDALSKGPAFSTLASLGGQFIDHVYAPGVLVSFPSATNATRAALRCHPDLARNAPGGAVPAMALDVAGDVKGLSGIVSEMPENTVSVTQTIAKRLSGEPLEFMPGQAVLLDDGREVATQVVNVNSHNMGWALPTLSTGAPSYVRRTEPAVVNIQMGKPERTTFFRLPWKLFFFLGFVFFGLLAAYQITQTVLEEIRSESTPQTGEAEAEVIENEPIELVEGVEDLVPVYSPIPQGYGTVVVQTVPSKAKIFLNDELVGETSPVVLENKSNKESYKLTVQGKGYETYTSIFNVEANQRKVLDVRLAKQIPKKW